MDRRKASLYCCFVENACDCGNKNESYTCTFITLEMQQSRVLHVSGNITNFTSNRLCRWRDSNHRHYHYRQHRRWRRILPRPLPPPPLPFRVVLQYLSYLSYPFYPSIYPSIHSFHLSIIFIYPVYLSHLSIYLSILSIDSFCHCMMLYVWTLMFLNAVHMRPHINE